MYIDESGVPSYNDSSKYYQLSGIITKNDNIKAIKKAVFDYKYDHFEGEYIDAEIHTYDICKAKKEFSGLLEAQKNKLLDELYTMVSKLPIQVITIAIDKDFLKQQKPNWKIFKTAWTILASRFDTYLEELGNSEKGRIKIDRITADERSELRNILKEIRSNTKKYQRIDNIVGDPMFLVSNGAEGIQIADAVAYCTAKYLGGNGHFQKYWTQLQSKLHSKNGKYLGYGLIVFPPKETKSEGTRP